MSFEDHYYGWIRSRLAGVKKYIPESVFKSKTLLELGSGHGQIGEVFNFLGAVVTCSDARQEHIETIHRNYPFLQVLLLDADTDPIPRKYDIIVHWGLLYHLHEIERHLEEVSKKCDILLLETEVCDSDKDDFSIVTQESGYDQAFNSKGIRPSQSYVEKVLSQNGFTFRCIQDPILNSSLHIYDWAAEHTDTWAHGKRRFWICWKGVESPIRPGL